MNPSAASPHHGSPGIGRPRTTAARGPGHLLALVLGLGLGVVTQASAASSTLRVVIQPRFDASPLGFDATTYTNGHGQAFSVTRLDFLVSNFAMRRPDGTWVVRSNDIAYISARDGRTAFMLAGIPNNSFDRVRFHVGLPSRENHADPAGLAAEHPLNPNLNGLHWSWQGGYVFMAMEGNWRTTNGALGGYSWHLATDPLLATVELPVALPVTNDMELHLVIDAAKMVAGLRVIPFNDGTTSTHSRPGDSLARQLHENLERAFLVDRVQHKPFGKPPLRGTAVVDVSPAATPFRLTISAAFPRPALPLDNPLSEERVELGRRLFHDSRLSINGQQSCASCHQAATAFAEARTVSIGAEGQLGTRNAMPLLNLAWKGSFFWDGRASSLRQQVLMPIENPGEMHESLTNVVAKLQRDPHLAAAFASAFGTPEVTADRLARALEQFLLVQVSHDSKFDQMLAGRAQLTDEETRGFELFHTEYDPRRGQFGADCFHCHGGPLFQSQGFANNGLDAEFADAGRFDATRKPGDRGKFAAPSLRNVAVTGPYMHDGRMATIEEVVAHYNAGVIRSETLDPNLAKHPPTGLGLSEPDQRALVAFLKTLTDKRFLRGDISSHSPR